MATPEPQHITYLDPVRDGVGHVSWSCILGDAEGSGYETGIEAVSDAAAHGPLAADSPTPADLDYDDEAAQVDADKHQLPPLPILTKLCRYLSVSLPLVPLGVDSRDLLQRRRRTVTGTAVATALVGRVNNHIMAVDPHTPAELADLRTTAMLELLDGDVDAAIALGMVMFVWSTDVLKRLTEDVAIDHLVEALGLLFSVHRRGVAPAVAEQRTRLAVRCIRNAAVDLATIPPHENDGTTP